MMKRLVMTIAVLAFSAGAAAGKCPEWLNHTVQKLHSSEAVNLCEHVGDRAILVINTASHCGFVNQFKGLEELHQNFSDKGLVVLGFPSNDFDQEAGSEKEIANVCYKNYGVSFLMSEPVSVKGESAHPVFKHLGAQVGEPNWNFNKFIVDRDGKVHHRLESFTSPDDVKLLSAIKRVL